MVKLRPRTIVPQWRGSPGGSSVGSTGGGAESDRTRDTGSPQESNAELSSGFADYSFGFANLAASQTALQGTRDIAGTQSQISVPMPYPGSIIAMSYRSNAAKTAGSVTFVPYITSVATGAVTTWSVNTSGDVASFSPATYVFDTGDLLDVRVTTNSTFAPATADVEVILYVSFQS